MRHHTHGLLSSNLSHKPRTISYSSTIPGWVKRSETLGRETRIRSVDQGKLDGKEAVT